MFFSLLFAWSGFFVYMHNPFQSFSMKLYGFLGAVLAFLLNEIGLVSLTLKLDWYCNIHVKWIWILKLWAFSHGGFWFKLPPVNIYAGASLMRLSQVRCARLYSQRKGLGQSFIWVMEDFAPAFGLEVQVQVSHFQELGAVFYSCLDVYTPGGR